MSNKDTQIVLRDLSKFYTSGCPVSLSFGRLFGTPSALKRIEAVRGVTLSIGKGEAVGLIGPNGAGKSTITKMLAGIMRPSSGEVIVNGRIPFKERIKHVASIGVVFGQKTQLWWDLPVQQSFDLLRDIYHLQPERYRRTRDNLIERLSLGAFLSRPVRQLSLGQRMRAEFAAALLREPSLVILDEPTIGLDAPAKIAVRQFIHELVRDRGTTVLLTTHDMHDIEEIVDRVLLIGKGKILADGPLERLRSEIFVESELQVEFAGEPSPLELPEGISLIDQSGNRITVAFDPTKRNPAEVISQIISGRPVTDVRLGPRSIEEFISHFYRVHGALEA
ncbi:ATP-binding cassette domain-containing protein [Rhizobium ruizarguesonis]|uniref:ABC transporter ATP-binding protein n=1 Tax=Rhizobium ruizarguesonis TaxID=2081791 RepID=UPI00371FE2C3